MLVIAKLDCLRRLISGEAQKLDRRGLLYRNEIHPAIGDGQANVPAQPLENLGACPPCTGTSLEILALRH